MLCLFQRFAMMLDTSDFCLLDAWSFRPTLYWRVFSKMANCGAINVAWQTHKEQGTCLGGLKQFRRSFLSVWHTGPFCGFTSCMLWAGKTESSIRFDLAWSCLMLLISGLDHYLYCRRFRTVTHCPKHCFLRPFPGMSVIQFARQIVDIPLHQLRESIVCSGTYKPYGFCRSSSYRRPGNWWIASDFPTTHGAALLMQWLFCRYRTS